MKMDQSTQVDEIEVSELPLEQTLAFDSAVDSLHLLN